MNEIIDGVLDWIRMAFGFLVSKLFPALIILVIGILAIRLLMHIVNKALERSKLEKASHSLVKSVLQTVLYVLLGLTVAASVGIDVTGIVALASVLTLAVSLSVQNMLTNLIGGFTLLHTNPFEPGDFVEIAGQSGTVKEIGLPYTKLATADNKIVFIPNSVVVAEEIVNYTTSGTRRVEIKVSASYDSQPETVLEALQEAAKLPTVLESPAPVVGLKSYGDSAIEYVLYIWCKTPDYSATLFGCNRKIKEVFDARGIEMTYPHLNVHLDK